MADDIAPVIANCIESTVNASAASGYSMCVLCMVMPGKGAQQL